MTGVDKREAHQAKCIDCVKGGGGALIVLRWGGGGIDCITNILYSFRTRHAFARPL